MNELLQTLSEEAQEELRQVEQPDWVEPMLATLIDKRFSDENWIFERKLDGERCIAYHLRQPRFPGCDRTRTPKMWLERRPSRD
jgi:ATP-dependent DNA ligase